MKSDLVASTLPTFASLLGRSAKLSAVLALLAFGLLNSGLQANPFTIDAENASINSDLSITDNGQSYIYYGTPTPLVRDPAIVSGWGGPSRSGSYHLKFDKWAAPANEPYSKTRSEHVLIRSDQPDLGIKQGQTVYLGFSFKIDNATGPVVDWVVFQQLQQFGNPPSLEMQIKKGTDNRLAMKGFWDDGSVGGHGTTAGYYELDLQKGDWYDFIVKFKSSTGTNSDGTWALWWKKASDTNYNYAYSYTGKLGHIDLPDPQGRNNNNCRIGMYGSARNPRTIFYFDNVTTAGWWSGANPAR